MFRIVSPGEFLREVSRSPRLKFFLAWLTFAGLVVPLAFFTSIGLAETHAVALLLVAILPFQYLAFCVMRAREMRRALLVKKFEEALLASRERVAGPIVRRTLTYMDADLLIPKIRDAYRQPLWTQASLTPPKRALQEYLAELCRDRIRAEAMQLNLASVDAQLNVASVGPPNLVSAYRSSLPVAGRPFPSVKRTPQMPMPA
jgi:hypothetical protein